MGRHPKFKDFETPKTQRSLDTFLVRRSAESSSGGEAYTERKLFGRIKPSKRKRLSNDGSQYLGKDVSSATSCEQSMGNTLADYIIREEAKQRRGKKGWEIKGELLKGRRWALKGSFNRTIAEKYPDTETTTYEMYSQTPVVMTPERPRKLRLTQGQLPPRPCSYAVEMRGNIVRRELSLHIR